MEPNPSEIVRKDEIADTVVDHKVPPGEVVLIPCAHCDWLLEQGEKHYCPPCHTWHTPDATWEEV